MLLLGFRAEHSLAPGFFCAMSHTANFDEPVSPRFDDPRSTAFIRGLPLYTFPLSSDLRCEYETIFPAKISERAESLWKSDSPYFAPRWQILSEYAYLRSKLITRIPDAPPKPDVRRAKILMEIAERFDEGASLDEESDIFLYIDFLRELLHSKIKRILSSLETVMNEQDAYDWASKSYEDLGLRS